MPGVAVFREGEVAVITGVGPGMGRSIALGFAARGVDVVLAARRKERLDAVADEVRALGREPLVQTTDLSDRDSCHALIDATLARFGRVDILVQNGHHEGDWQPATTADPDVWRGIFEINFFGALHLAQRAIPVMREQGRGSIVLVNSGAAVRNPPTMGAYSASKAALASLTRTLALEVGGWGIRVNGVFLGPVAGENLFRMGKGAASAEGSDFEQWLETKAHEMPLGTIPTPDECAGAVLFFCSELAAPITGQHLAVNGGQWIS
jgi:NAD(P)-dependent dehydrogenase (short-subunit alcohol dehydrogenase family)